VEQYLSIERFFACDAHWLDRARRACRRKDGDGRDRRDPAAGTLSAHQIRAASSSKTWRTTSAVSTAARSGYLDFTGNLDTCIADSNRLQKNGKVFVRSGAGIVADSVTERANIRSA
jgi:anthranilate synthase component 1